MMAMLVRMMAELKAGWGRLEANGEELADRQPAKIETGQAELAAKIEAVHGEQQKIRENMAEVRRAQWGLMVGQAKITEGVSAVAKDSTMCLELDRVDRRR